MQQKHTNFISISEALLPLLFFSNNQIFYAALVIPVAAAITLFVFEMLRSQTSAALKAFYFFWLALCAGLSWAAGGLPPYWILSLYLLMPPALLAPSEFLRAKPFLYGFKKYAKSRIKQLALTFLLAVFFAGMVIALRKIFHGIEVWILAVPALLFFEVAAAKIRERRA